MRDISIKLNLKSARCTFLLILISILTLSSHSFSLNTTSIFSRISGTWELDKELSFRLGGSFRQLKKVQMTFKVSHSFYHKLSKRLLKQVNKRKLKIVLGGELIAAENGKKIEKQNAVFFIVLMASNPVIIFEFEGRYRKSVFHAYISIALAKDKKNDILFIGGYRPFKAFSAFKHM